MNNTAETGEGVASAAPSSYEGIAVLGSHPQTVQAAPFDDPNWLIYACSPHNLAYAYDQHQAHMWFGGTVPQEGRSPNLRYLNGGKRPDGGKYRVDQWFEVHLPLADETRQYGYLRELEKLDVVWMRDPEGLMMVKGARQFPEAEITKRFGPFFWTSSIAFMLAKAIVDAEQLGIKRIGIWGVMQASEGEYTYQRPGVQYWIQRADELGIEVIAPEESRLFEPQRVKF